MAAVAAVAAVAVVVGTALAAVTFWCCQARKKDGYLASNQAAYRSFLNLQSKRCVDIWFEESVNAHSFNAMT